MDDEMKAALQKASDEIRSIVAERDRYKQALEEIKAMSYGFRDRPSPYSLGHASNRALYALDPTHDPLPKARRECLRKNPCHHGVQCTGGGVNCGPSKY